MPLQTLTIARRKIAACLRLSRPKPRYPALPPELISKIIHHTLLTPDPLYLLIATGTIPKSKRRLARPHLNDMALAQNFHSICLVSKYFRAEAMKTFFSRNYWQLEVRLYVPTKRKGIFHGKDWRINVLLGMWWVVVHIAQIWDKPYPEPMRLGTKVDALTVLGEEALGLMSNVKLAVVRYAHMGVYFDVLNDTMAALKRGKRLERLVVQFLPHQGRDVNRGCVRYSSCEMPDLMKYQGLDEERVRKEEIGQWIRGYWEKMEDVLGCLGKVGPVREVVVCGCVTDEYSFWLEGMIREGLREGEERVFDRGLERRKMRGLM
ncbi:hypothetical protein DL98DRAFT_522987 [Cadophora sp. DSE1049]|nr:hypothetical protein DL98DRAFT_522987 [Cadophora sp. DSE1049]